MPTISMFFGIIIRMNFGDHVPPHIHASYQGQDTAYDFDGEPVNDATPLPRKQDRLVRAWIELHHDELMANWELAAHNEQVYRIEPLKG